MEDPIEMDDWGVPLFSETSISQDIVDVPTKKKLQDFVA